MTTFNFANLYGFVVKSMDDYISFQRILWVVPLEMSHLNFPITIEL